MCMTDDDLTSRYPLLTESELFSTDLFVCAGVACI